MNNETRQMLQDLRTAIDIALSEVEAAHNFTLDIGVMTWDPSLKKVTCRMTGHQLIPGEDKWQVERREWQTHCSRVGLAPEDFHREIRHGGDTFRLEGIKPSRSKYPITATKIPRGGTYKFPIATIKRALAQEAS